MLYELRIYEATPGKMPALVNRFVNTTLKMFKKHGIRPVVFLEPVVGTSNQLTYLVEWESLAEREQRWNAFQSDPEWISARAALEEAGPIVDRFTNTILREVPAITAVLQDK